MNLRRTSLTFLLKFLAAAGLAFLFMAAPSATGVAPAQAQVSGEFQAALQPYGAWRRHARWGTVWVPAHRPNGWRPYTHGHWVYTQEWGWYWISDRDEEDWGWVTFHYGRWIFERGMGGWVWRSGNEWGPAWVAWRRGDDTIGWTPMPPDELSADYDEAPDFWIFVPPRYLTDARVRAHMVPRAGLLSALRATVMVSRAQAQGRVAHNPGVAPATVGAAARTSIPVYRVAPRVLAGTKGVTGAVAVQPRDLARRGDKRFGVSVFKTSATIKPAASVPQAEPLADKAPSGSPPHEAQPVAAPSGVEHGVVTPVKPPSAIRPHRPIAPQPPPPVIPPAAARKSPPPAAVHAPPHPVIAPVSKPVAHPVARPVAKPVAKPVARPVAKPVARSKPSATKRPAAANKPTSKKPAPKKPTSKTRKPDKDEKKPR